MVTPAEVVTEALELPESERSWVVSKILDSFSQDPNLSPSWHREIAERIARSETEGSQHVSSEEVHRDMRKIFSP